MENALFSLLPLFKFVIRACVREVANLKEGFVLHNTERDCMDAKQLLEGISHSILSHANLPTKPSKAVRKWDGKTPYGVHPAWCAMSILQEAALPEEIREVGAEALLFHDLLEDTTAALPEGTGARVRELVEGMTFTSSDEEMEKVWERSAEIRLLKLYDKASNLLDGVWMTPEKLERYRAYAHRLADDVESNYGLLNIVRIARAL